ncbi:hypothetical protein [Streptomyces sp. NPDC051636]|uniref:hypothetical protein n=1 Tax=Streptomyces sp. NPDC051636 TaxID=3365663 RepID=UPI0037B3BA5D
MLRRVAGGREVMAEQVMHMVRLAERASCTTSGRAAVAWAATAASTSRSPRGWRRTAPR